MKNFYKTCLKISVSRVMSFILHGQKNGGRDILLTSWVMLEVAIIMVLMDQVVGCYCAKQNQLCENFQNMKSNSNIQIKSEIIFFSIRAWKLDLHMPVVKLLAGANSMSTFAYRATEKHPVGADCTCKQCGKKFFNSARLERHLKTHMGMSHDSFWWPINGLSAVSMQ